RFLALREASDEAAAEGTEDREYDEVGHRLVDRVGQETLFEHGGPEVIAGPLERGDKEIRAGARHAAEDDGRDRERDQCRHDPANEARDEDIGRAEVAPDREEGDQTDDRADQEQRDEPAEDDEDRGGGRRSLRWRGEEQQLEHVRVGIRVERQEPVDPDDRNDDGDDRGADRELRRRGVGAAPEEPESSEDPGEKPDLDRDDEEGRGVRRLEWSRQDVGPDQVREPAGHGAGDRSREDADEDRPDRVQVHRDLQGGRDGLPEDDVDGDRDRDEHDRARVELGRDRVEPLGLRVFGGEIGDERDDQPDREDRDDGVESDRDAGLRVRCQIDVARQIDPQDEDDEERDDSYER